MSRERYKTNPFLKPELIPVEGRQVKIAPMEGGNPVLVNQDGQAQGTHLVTYRKVDAEQFVKLFTDNIALTFSLGSPGIKAFNVLLWAVQRYSLNRDMVDLDSFVLQDFCEGNRGKPDPVSLSLTTFKRGLNELEKTSIIAKTLRKGRYFINPHFVFNGNRIAFTTLIEREG